MERWGPKGAGGDFEFNRSTACLEPYRDSLRIITGLENRQAYIHPDGNGGHARASSTFLTATRPHKTAIDFLREEARLLNEQLGLDDRRKLDEYLTGIREIESQIQESERFGLPADPNHPTPEGIPESYREHMRLMMDVMSIAFVTDTTRVATLILAHDVSNRPLRDINIGDGHHDLSHHGKNPDRLEKQAQIDTFYCEQLAYLLKTMQSHKLTGGSTLLDQTMLVYGSGINDGDLHNHVELPIIYAGGAAGESAAGSIKNSTSPHRWLTCTWK
jgi:hypothetical protein